MLKQIDVGPISFEIDDQGRVTVRGATSAKTVMPADDGFMNGNYEVTVESGNMSCWFLDIFLTGDHGTPLHNERPLALVMRVDQDQHRTEVFAQNGIGDWTKRVQFFSSSTK